MVILIKILVGIFAGVCSFPLSAYAHFTTEMGDFYGGILHPITDSQTILPILGFALWTSQQGIKQAGKMMMLYAGIIPIGAFMGFMNTGFLPGHVFWLCVLAGIGCLITCEYRPGLPLAFAITVVLSIYAGYANVFEVKDKIGDPVLYIVGLILGAGLLVLYLTGFLLSRKVEWKNIAIRIAGCFIFVAGVLFFVLKFPF
ncbi:MAG: HupE/UreJ family protein [Desulfobacula sp.]|uniref:HupE/UreJ family protein n=1 Tax=Desulfobacula sp. TaxID=2593537 RepID=UPI0025BC845E|nr:HupE/UreJ family protein [Desulfobacula sp.]MCD4721146.1 HupE/UreJ family protein [Desulfobacula sp.]